MTDRCGQLTLGRWVRDRAVATPDRTAIETAAGTAVAERTTYAQLDARSEQRAADLLLAGLVPGDRVATLTGNSAAHAELLFGCAKAGLALVPLNWRLTAPELAYQIDDAAPALLYAAPGYAELAAAALAAARTGPHCRELGPVTPTGRPCDIPVGDDDPLLVMYTSGTTGRPKGAVLTHANCFWTNLSLSRTAPLTGEDVVLQVLPQFHVGGWNVQPLLAWWTGATVLIEDGFDPTRVLTLIARRHVTTMMGVPATYLFLAEQPAFASADLSSLRLAIVGGAPMPEPLLRRWQDRGVRLVQGYGLTEAAPNVLCLPAEDATGKLGYAGKPYPHVDVALADPGSGELIAGAGSGELLVRGPNVFAGYWRNAAATAAAHTDGWLRTGDLAERDGEGFYRICDRIKDLYVTGGENVYPAEVEAALHEHPAIREAAVVGVPDPRWGEVGLAVVALWPGAAADSAELIAHCRRRLAGFKVPRAVRYVEALPRSTVDKIPKTELRERYRADPDADWERGR